MALVRCPDCGRDVSDAAPSCPGCGRPMKGTSAGAPPQGAPIACPRCGSTQLSDQKRGFSAGRAIGGGLLLGGVGLLAGTLGSRRVTLTCMSCGFAWTAGDIPKPRRSNTAGCLVVVLVLAGIGAIGRACEKSHPSAGPTTSVAAAPSPTVTAATGPDDLSAFVLQYGKPDVDDSTAFDKPRPPIVTRWFVYKKEHVRVTFVPDGPATADARLAKRWNLVAFQDDRTKQAISDSEAASRLKARSISGK